jgi:hypothetical protein
MAKEQQELDRKDDPLSRVETDLDIYKTLLDLWSKENSIKTTKLQTLLTVNALLVAALTISGGVTRDKWFVYLTGAVFSLIWTFSIGRTCLFQDIWQVKLKEMQQRHPNEPRFAILETAQAKKQTRGVTRLFGAVPSKWYLLFSPFGLAIGWLFILFSMM